MIKEIIKNVVIIGITIVITLGIVNSIKTENLGGVPKAPSYNTALSSAVSVGTLANTTVLTQKGARGYARICNDSASEGYIYLYSTTTISTTSASTILPTKTCYEITSENLYTGVVGYVSGEATSTSMFVTELIGY